MWCVALVEQCTDVVEEYLETIYRLQEKQGAGAKTNDIVRTLKVVPGTVTNTIERLEREGYVSHEPYKGVRLTEKGRRIAAQVVRRHRLSERLLTDILHVGWGKAHEVACKIEHDIADEEVMGSIEKALGNPKTCPHGNPIPGKDGESINEGEKPGFSLLSDLSATEGGTIVRVVNEDVEVLQYLSRLGLVPGAFVEILRKEPIGELVTLRLRNSATHIISQRAASVIEVKVERVAMEEERTARSKAEGKVKHVSKFGEYEH